jgi:hypothetical protein
MAEYTDLECPNCHQQAPRCLDGEGFAFQFAAGGKSPANSGVHDHDYPTADKIVGRSADVRWNFLRARDKVKEEARRIGGTRALIRHTGQDSIAYEPMTETGLHARRRFAKDALEVIRSKKAERT